MNRYSLLETLLAEGFDPSKKVLDAAKKVSAKVVPNRRGFNDPSVQQITLRKGDIGLEISWLTDDPGILSWVELEWKRSAKPKTGSSGNDPTRSVISRIGKFFK